MATAVINGVSGHVGTHVDTLVERMRELLQDVDHARELGAGAQRIARGRFGIERFARDWDETICCVSRIGTPPARYPPDMLKEGCPGL
jgi:hypothetical protein